MGPLWIIKDLEKILECIDALVINNDVYKEW